MKNGFTLIELLVVVLIIGVLAAVALPQYQKAVLKARYVKLMTAGDLVNKAEELFYLANGKYTDNLDDLDIKIEGKNFIFALDVRADGHAALNILSPRQEMGYILYFKQHNGGDELSGRRECRVYNKSETLKQICQSLTGGTGVDVGSYIAYVFK